MLCPRLEPLIVDKVEEHYDDVIRLMLTLGRVPWAFSTIKYHFYFNPI